MNAMVSQITGNSTAYSKACSAIHYWPFDRWIPPQRDSKSENLSITQRNRDNASLDWVTGTRVHVREK